MHVKRSIDIPDVQCVGQLIFLMFSILLKGILTILSFMASCRWLDIPDPRDNLWDKSCQVSFKERPNKIQMRYVQSLSYPQKYSDMMYCVINPDVNSKNPLLVYQM